MIVMWLAFEEEPYVPLETSNALFFRALTPSEVYCVSLMAVCIHMLNLTDTAPWLGRHRVGSPRPSSRDVQVSVAVDPLIWSEFPR